MSELIKSNPSLVALSHNTIAVPRQLITFIIMNFSYPINTTILHQDDNSWLEHYHDERHHVWLPQPSIHALSPPPLHYDMGRLSSTTCAHDDNDDKYAEEHDNNFAKSPPGRHDNDGVCIPRTITIPSVPVTPENIRATADVHQETVSTHDHDDCSSVGMETVLSGKRRRRKQHCREEQKKDDVPTVNVNPKFKHMKQLKGSATVRYHNQFYWDGSLSYLDGMPEHESLMSEKKDDEMSIGTFDVSHCVSTAIGKCFEDDSTVVSSGSSSSDDSDGDFVVIAQGYAPMPASSRPKAPLKQVFGRTKFTRHLPNNFCKK
jgi:hypothetical protein